MAIKTEPVQKRIRAYSGGEVIADSTDVLMVWETPYYPTYYIPISDVSIGKFQASHRTENSPSRGEANFYDLNSEADAAYWYPEPKIDALRDHVVVRWDAMDAWFEEEEQVYVHARDPFKRIDALQSSRHIRVEIDGETVADSRRPVLLFETALPTRYYLPKTDVDMTKLTPTSLATDCPYKGTAQYWSVTTKQGVTDNIVWGYQSPVHESAAIAGLVSFYNEKVDIYVDDVLQETPKTVFS